MEQLTFAKVQPVRFGDFTAMPEKLTSEAKLRINNLGFATESQIEEAKKALSECFGASSAEVKAFMDDNMSVSDLQSLQTYLTQGPQGLKTLQEAVNGAIQEAMRKAKDETN